MGVTKLVIFLDRPIYCSGETISGRLVVEVDKPVSTKGIYLKYSGEANVHWTESRGSGSDRSRKTYSNVEKYLELQQLVFGNDEDDCELTEGEYVFVFNCQLPMNLPSSFEGQLGRIRYSVKAKIIRPWKSNHVARQPFTVTAACDLNHIELATGPVDEEASKTFWGQSKKQLHMSISLPVRGYVPGQILAVKVSLNNESEVGIKSLYVGLEQIVTFHATTKSKTVGKHVFQNEFPVPEGFGCEEVPLHLQLPPLPPSYLEGCRIIDLNYQLHVQAKVDAWYHRNLHIRTELIVGNIPVMSYQMPIPLYETVDQEGPSYSEAPDCQPPAYGFVVPPGNMYGDLSLPTYERSIGFEGFEKNNSEHISDSDGKATEFAPVYPVYKFGATQNQAS